jgi:hypothetical protein
MPKAYPAGHEKISALLEEIGRARTEPGRVAKEVDWNWATSY